MKKIWMPVGVIASLSISNADDVTITGPLSFSRGCIAEYNASPKRCPNKKKATGGIFGEATEGICGKETYKWTIDCDVSSGGYISAPVKIAPVCAVSFDNNKSPLPRFPYGFGITCKVTCSGISLSGTRGAFVTE